MALASVSWLPMSPVSMLRHTVTFCAGLLFGILAGYLATGLQTWPGPVFVLSLAGLVTIFLVWGMAGVIGRAGSMLVPDKLGRTIGQGLGIAAGSQLKSRVAIYLSGFALGLALTSVVTLQMAGAAVSSF